MTNDTPSPETYMQPEADFWTTHNNFENGSMFGIGLVSDEGKDCWDFAKQEWVKADVPVFRSPAPQANMRVTDAHIERLTEAVEGECDGLAIDAEQAKAILSHVFVADELVTGWQMVPREPTDKMTFVGQAMRHNTVNSIGAIYCEMLSVAPPAPQTREVG